MEGETQAEGVEQEILQKMYGISNWNKNPTYLGIQEKDVEVKSQLQELIHSEESTGFEEDHRSQQHRKRDS